MRKVQVPTRVFPWCIFGVTCTDQCQAFLYQHLSTTVFMATVECCKTICRFTLFNLTIDHLHKLVSPFSTESIRLDLRLQYVSIIMHCILSFPGTRQIFELD